MFEGAALENPTNCSRSIVCPLPAPKLVFAAPPPLFSSSGQKNAYFAGFLTSQNNPNNSKLSSMILSPLATINIFLILDTYYLCHRITQTTSLPSNLVYSQTCTTIYIHHHYKHVTLSQVNNPFFRGIRPCSTTSPFLFSEKK